METTQQILILGGGLMVAFGFMFMGAFSLSGLTNSQAPQDNSQEFNATMPEENFVEGGFGIGVNEQINLAVQNQVVFVNAIYNEDSSVFDELEGIEEEFDGRVYYATVNSTDTQLDSQLQVSNYPEIVVIGDQNDAASGTAYTLATAENNRESVVDQVCSAMASVGSLGATCY